MSKKFPMYPTLSLGFLNNFQRPHNDRYFFSFSLLDYKITIFLVVQISY